MQAAELVEIQQRIEAEISATEAAVATYRELNRPVAPDNAIGRLSRLDAINNKGVTEAALRQAEAKLLQLRQMLTRLHEPDFGRCWRCHALIPLGLLLLLPHSRFCVQCAS